MGFKELLNTAYSQSEIDKPSQADIRINQNEVLVIFDAFRSLCEKHHLVYMMGGGSALGTVRHQGFIPWDDDIDINMPRKDFEQLKEYSHELGNEYIFCAPNYNNTAVERFGKIFIVRDKNADWTHNAAIDIFVIENLPRNRLYRTIKGIAATFGMGIAAVSSFYNNRSIEMKKVLCASLKGTISYYLRVFIGFNISFIPTVKLYNFSDKINQYHKETGISGVPSGRKHYFGEQFLTEVYLPTVEGVFEGRKVPLENKVDQYLTNLYGENYMELPPESQRERHIR